MDSYLSRRTKPVEKTVKKKKEKVESTSEEEFKEEAEDFYSNKKPFFSRIVDMIVGEPSPKLSEEIEVVEEEVTTNAPKRGFFSALRGWFSPDFEAGEEYDEHEEEVLVNDDLKEILKIQNKWLGQLPAEKMREFKKSDDYKVYKDTLTRYKLIKEKE